MADIDQTLEVILKEYPEDRKMLKRAEYVPPYTIKGTFEIDPLWNIRLRSAEPVEKPPVGHFTHLEAGYCYNQMSYVLMAYLAQLGMLKGVRPLTLGEMNQKKFNKMVVAEKTIRHSRPIDSGNPFTGQLTIARQRLVRSPEGASLFIWQDYDFMDCAAYGSVSGVMTIDSSELLHDT